MFQKSEIAVCTLIKKPKNDADRCRGKLVTLKSLRPHLSQVIMFSLALAYLNFNILTLQLLIESLQNSCCDFSRSQFVRFFQATSNNAFHSFFPT